MRTMDTVMAIVMANESKRRLMILCSAVLLVLLGPAIAFQGCAGCDTLGGSKATTGAIQSTQREQGDIVLTGRVVVRDMLGRNRIVLDPDKGLEIVDESGNTVMCIRLIADCPGGGVMELGRFTAGGSGVLGPVTNPAISIGHNRTGSFCVMGDAGGSLSLTPGFGLEHGRR